MSTATTTTSDSNGAELRLIPDFDGSGEQSIVEWLEKLELVCDLRGITKIESVIPLRLSGGAFAVYQQLSPSDKKDVNAVKDALITSFAPDRFSAYEKFISRRLQPGESVDVLLADLRKLAASFGGMPEKALSCAFVTALPEHVRQLLRAGSRMDSLSLTQLLARARAILVDDSAIACAATVRPARWDRSTGVTDSVRKPTPVKCRRCGGPHTIRDCKCPVICWSCGGQGHKSTECPPNQGKAHGAACAPAASPQPQ